MSNDLLDFIFTINGKNKTIKNIIIIFFSPWLMFIFSLLLGFLLDMLRKAGINTLHIVPSVVAIGCFVVSIIYLVAYFYSWRKIYNSYVKKGLWPRKSNQN